MKAVRLVAALVVIDLVGAGLLAWRVYTAGRAPLPVATSTVFDLPRGASLRSALSQLESQGAIAHPRWLYWYARAAELTNVRAGSYLLEPGQTHHELLAMLTEGRVRTEQFTLPEGYNRWQMRDTLAAEGWIAKDVFDRLCDDKEFLARHDIPGPTCDGYLFPETYTFARGVAPEVIFAAMFATFNRLHDQVTAESRGPLNLDKRALTTLASIVEKETGAPQERPRIACVFYNRLQANPPWRLDTDPTVIYAATLENPGFDGNIKRSHLRALDNPYNTYLNHGLPPGPIASPGRAALEAVVHPANCEDFLFVSKNDGTHVFCPTLACHNAAVQKWQVEYFRRR